MSGTKGKSGGARRYAGRPRQSSGKKKVQFNLGTTAIERLARIPRGCRSAFIENLILDQIRYESQIVINESISIPSDTPYVLDKWAKHQ